MISSKTKTGLSETLPNKKAPSTPRISKSSKAPTRADSSLSSSLQSSHLSIDRSPRLVDSKPAAFGRRSPKVTTSPDKVQRLLKFSELQALLGSAQEDLKKVNERLASVEKEKARVVEELKEAKRSANKANEKLREALIAQKQAEESSEINKFRADELEQAGIEAAQKREEEWQKELNAVQNQHASEVAALLSMTQELQRVKQELSMISEAKDTALTQANEAMKIAEINDEKGEILSGEVSRLKALLDSRVEAESREASNFVNKLNLEVDLLKGELERAEKAGQVLSEMEIVIEGLKTEVISTKKAALDAGNLVHEWKKKVELLETQATEITQSQRLVSESLTSVMMQLEEKNMLLQDAESEIASLTEKVKLMEISLGTHEADVKETERCLEMVKQEAKDIAETVETLKSELQCVKERKAQALSNEQAALSTIQSLLKEKDTLLNELETSRGEDEKSKNAMESLASALHEVSMEARGAKEKLAANQAESEIAEFRMEELKSAFAATKENYEAMIDEMKDEISQLEGLVEKSQIEAENIRIELGKKDIEFMKIIENSRGAFDMAKKEMGMLAENEKAEWHEKELGFIISIKDLEEEITTLKVERDDLVYLLQKAEGEAQTAKGDGEKLRNKLTQVESVACSAKEAAENEKTESLRLKEMLLDKENELQCITQENDDLRAREAAFIEKIEELSKLLEEALAKRMEENSELSNSEKSYYLLPKLEEFAVENGNGNDGENTKILLLEPVVRHGAGDYRSSSSDLVGTIKKCDNGNAREEGDDFDSIDVKMWENCKIVDQGVSPDTELEPEPHEDEKDLKIDCESFHQVHGLPSETMDNGGRSPRQQQKKKKPLLWKFGSLLKKKSHPK